MHYAKCKKPKIKGYIFYDSIYVGVLQRKNLQGYKTDQGFPDACLRNQKGLAGLITTLNLSGEYQHLQEMLGMNKVIISVISYENRLLPLFPVPHNSMIQKKAA